jgi:diguanylate cyclase (GGDEF)-like protein
VVLKKLKGTIAGRLYLIGALALSAVVALAAVSIYFASSTRQAAEQSYGPGLIEAVLASEIEQLLEQHRRLVEAIPGLTGNDQRQAQNDKATAVSDHIMKLVARTDARFSTTMMSGLPELWRLTRLVALNAARTEPAAPAAALRAYIAEAERQQKVVRTHRGERIALTDRNARKLTASARTLVNWVAAIGLLACLLIGPLALFLLRRMLQRLERISLAMMRLAENDIAIEIEGVGEQDELGSMATAVSVFRANAGQILDQQRKLQELNRWLDIALNNMTRGLSMFDKSERLVVCNATYLCLYDLPDELGTPGVPFDRIMEHRSRISAGLAGREAEGNDALDNALRDLTQTFDVGRVKQTMKDGRTIEVVIKPLPWGGWVALHEDITEHEAAAERVRRLASEDTLTGLANRHQFRERLDDATRRLTTGAGFALCAIDLDRFKEVNDTWGHPTGDSLLVAVGNRLRDTSRQGDVVARLGGDEFAIIQSGSPDEAAARAFATRILAALHEPFLVNGQKIEIGGSIGIALAPAHGSAASTLMKNADLALYRAKSSKRGTICLFDAEFQNQVQTRRALETDLAHAVERGELSLHYQPIVSMKTGRVSGCEALLRWRHPERGMVSPAEFIPLAEQTGLIDGIGAWALAEACRTAAGWPSHMTVAVNLSVAQFAGPSLAAIASEALAASGLAPERLELEVTETLLLGDDPGTLAVLHGLRDLGIAISLDDFGTGYSSLSHLRSFPFDKIKIDQSFVRELPQRRNCEAIVGAVARLASSLSMTTVAEGVETTDHLERVAAAGCDAVQGYLFSRPVPASEVLAVIERIDASQSQRGMAAA